MEHLLNALFSLTELEQERKLTIEESTFYLYCVTTLQESGIEIPFGIEI